LLAAIFDLIRSRELSDRAEEIREIIRRGMDLVEELWGQELAARPALTAGDSVEFLAKDWRPLTFFFHYSLASNLRFRVGLGAGSVRLLREFADECDGPAFWSARSALETLSSKRGRVSVLNLEVGEGADPDDERNIYVAALSMAVLAEMPEKRAVYCFRRIWFGEKIEEIARRYGVSKGNVSKTLRSSGCFVISRLLGDARGSGGLRLR